VLVHGRIQRLADAQNQFDLMTPQPRQTRGAIGAGVIVDGNGCERIAPLRQRFREAQVEGMAQHGQLDRFAGGMQQEFRQDPRHQGQDACGIAIARGKIPVAVKIAEEKLRGGAHVRRRQEVGEAGGQPLRLPLPEQRQGWQQVAWLAVRIIDRLLPGQSSRQSFPELLVHSRSVTAVPCSQCEPGYNPGAFQGSNSMLLLQSARKPPRSQGRIGLAIAGGGPIGGMYELGALRALDRAIEGIDLTRLEVYVGVSSGAFLAAGLANRLDTAEMYRIFISGDSHEAKFRPDIFLQPAFLEYLTRAANLPRLAYEWWRDLLTDPTGSHLSDVVSRLGGLIPTGIFNNAEIERFLGKVFSSRSRSNDFRELERPLYVIAVDLDNGQAVRFGGPGWDDVPISRAVQASAALPGLYPPVDIRGRHFVDGALRRTMHASVVLDHGVDLMIGLNPLVPFNASRARSRPEGLDKLADGGLPVVLSQTFRTLLQSRMQVGLGKYAQKYPEVDQLVFEPNEDDGEMFFTNIFSYSSRQRVCEHAFQSTLADLRKQRAILGPVLARHGLRLRDEILDDPDCSVVDGLGKAHRPTDTTARLRRALDDVGHLIEQRRRSRARSSLRRR